MPTVPQDSLGRFMRKDGSAVAPAPESLKLKTPRRAQFKHFRVDAVLRPEHREEYEKLLADPNSTNKSLQLWLRERGYHVCRSAVGRHRQTFHQSLQRMRDCARMAETFCTLTRKRGAGAIAEASHAMFEMQLMENLFNIKNPDALPNDQLQQMAKTLQSAVATRRSVEEMRTEFEQQKVKAAREAENALKQGATGKDVVARVKEILGV